MINCLLDWFKFDVGEGAFYALFGFLVVFAGIVILILLFTALGKIMEQANKPHKPRKPRKNKKENEVSEESARQDEEGVTPELVAIISAAVAACLEDENVKCDFIVKRIRKL